MPKHLSLPGLIASAVRRGETRASIAAAVDCSRIHLWRLENGRIGEHTAVGRRLRGYLLTTRDAEAQTAAEIMEEIAQIDAELGANLLHMLRNVRRIARKIRSQKAAR